MVRRRYEEDSSVEDSEDYPLYRTPRLHGGQGTSAEQDATETSASKDLSWEEYMSRKRAIRHPGIKVHVNKIKSFVEDVLNYIAMLYECDHKYDEENLYPSRHRCRACNRGRRDPKRKCTLCKMVIHDGCRSGSNGRVPFPCIPATPMKDIKHPNLKECTANIPREFPKVPAILTKCFHELQETEKIKRPSYTLIDPADKKAIKKLSAKLRRHVNRDLADIPEQVIAGCVLKFLADTPIFLPEEEQTLVDLQKQLNGTTPKKDIVSEARHLVRKIDRYRLQTLAALMLHIRNLYVYHPMNKLFLPKMYEIFGESVKPIELLFSISRQFWRYHLAPLKERQRVGAHLPPAEGRLVLATDLPVIDEGDEDEVLD